MSWGKCPKDLLGNSLAPFVLPGMRTGGGAVLSAWTCCQAPGDIPGLLAGTDVDALISDSGSNQQFSFALTTLPTASTVVAAHMPSLFTLNKGKQKLFSAEHGACGRGYLWCDRGGTLPFSLWMPGDFFFPLKTVTDTQPSTKPLHTASGHQNAQERFL